VQTRQLSLKTLAKQWVAEAARDCFVCDIGLVLRLQNDAGANVGYGRCPGGHVRGAWIRYEIKALFLRAIFSKDISVCLQQSTAFNLTWELLAVVDNNHAPTKS
jgi:hypothetical protein